MKYPHAVPAAIRSVNFKSPYVFIFWPHIAPLLSRVGFISPFYRTVSVVLCDCWGGMFSISEIAFTILGALRCPVSIFDKYASSTNIPVLFDTSFARLACVFISDIKSFVFTAKPKSVYSAIFNKNHPFQKRWLDKYKELY